MAVGITKRQAFYLEQMQEIIRKQSDVADALHVLTEFWDLPMQINMDSLDQVKDAVDKASCFLPGILNLMADGIESRIHNAHLTINELESSLQPSFALKSDKGIENVPREHLEIKISINEKSLRNAYANGKLPDCFELAE